MADGELADKLRRLGLSARDIHPGQVYQLPDEDVHFPETEEERKSGKGVHPSRYAVVVQGDDSLSDPTHARILIVPMSASSLSRDPKPRYGIPVKCGDGNVPSDCLALVDHIQPVLKVRLKNYCGELQPRTFEQIQAVLLRILGHL
jgi:mRNA-degrading endonuclease toxin of MazEF toxin-antitoxin module